MPLERIPQGKGRTTHHTSLETLPGLFERVWDNKDGSSSKIVEKRKWTRDGGRLPGEEATC